MAEEEKKRKADGEKDDAWWSGDEEYLTPIDDELEEENEAAPSIQDSQVGYKMADTKTETEPGLVSIEEQDDYISIGTNADAVMDQIDDYTDDEDILADFAERQDFNRAGSDELLEKLEQHNFKKPEVSAGDLDADWEGANQSGEETVGGDNPTPDQDVVEEIGEALGINYAYNEPLRTADKLDARDRNRWELSPESLDDEDLVGANEGLVEELDDELDDLDDEALDEEVEEDELGLDEDDLDEVGDEDDELDELDEDLEDLGDDDHDDEDLDDLDEDLEDDFDDLDDEFEDDLELE